MFENEVRLTVGVRLVQYDQEVEILRETVVRATVLFYVWRFLLCGMELGWWL